ncbi:MAG: Asp-tRNA(Asn)/Glu-tRNA(Gln) amidotransferase subunit GatC [Pseudomonadota bacterium]|jgi:aspartyl-tRNA(Asn)/glutamyl-tRNA(Gln) amidotransferase subunit C
MSLTKEQVLRIAHLSRIALDEAGAERAQAELNGIFSLISQLQAADTTGVAPMCHAVDTAQRLREDRVTETDEREAFQAIAPDAEGGLYLVPRVIE